MFRGLVVYPDAGAGRVVRTSVVTCGKRSWSRSPRLSGAICEGRKEKRFCPAVHGRICPQCCGEQREVTLDCPSDCPYLQQAREHEKPRSAEHFDRASLFLHVEISDRFTYEREHLLMGLSYALAQAVHADRTLND